MENPRVIFEDSDILVLDKPTGWITNEASTTTNQPVVQTWLKENFKYHLIGDREMRDGIVHRLDKETSGILIVAKTPDAFTSLQKQFKEREIEKSYTALVHGELTSKKGEIKAPVGRLPWRRDRFGVLPGGRDAVTYYEVKGEYKDYTLLVLYPKTGRTHQIRIHLKYIGHPIVGDMFYAGRKTARGDRKWCPRLFLHASSIKFTHPINGKVVELSSELPKGLEDALKSLS